MPLDRRAFLKIASSAGVLTGLGAAARSVAIEPYVRPPEEELPGRATWYASTCRQCPAGCGILVRVINGRPRKIEGNPSHPLNRGKLCARGQAGLQALYNPDRLKDPVRQIGGRGTRNFEPLSWSDALETITSAFNDLSQVAFLGGMLPDHLFKLVNLFMNSLGAPSPVIYDLHSAMEGRSQAKAMSHRWFSSDFLPIYDIARAEVIFSFGANFLETWMSPVSQSHDYGTMRQGQLGGRGFLVQFEPRLSATAASADEWVPILPGTEGLIALAIGRIIVEENLGNVGSHRDYAHLYRNVSVGDISQASGLGVDDLRRLANIFADANRSMAIPGGNLAGHQNGPESMDAIMALNVVMQRLGREGGIFLPPQVAEDVFSTSVSPSSFADVQGLIERMRSGDVELLFIHGANPVYELPTWSGFKEALSEVPLVVNFSPFIDETTIASDLLLPDHTYLEGWGYTIADPGADRPLISGQQPVVRPLYNTRSTADVFLGLSARLGDNVAAALPWADEVAFLEESSADLIGSSIGSYDASTSSGFWSRWRQLGGWWSGKPIRQEPVAIGLPDDPLHVSAASFQGNADEFPLFLLPYESITLSDGRGANLPWLQETPDPMTTARWNSWVELNPQTAEKLGVTDNDLVRITSPSGQLDLPVVVYPAIRPDVIGIPMGQGHQDYGRFAGERGANVIELVAPLSERTGPKFYWGATRVRVEPLNREGKLARLENLDGEGRESIR
jgi:anaerobic selenocysteine-containing dehydrogenase